MYFIKEHFDNKFKFLRLELIHSITIRIKTKNKTVSYVHSIMDIIVERFPTLAVNIFKNLDDQSLVKFKKAGRDYFTFIIQERFYWIRIL